MEITRIFFAVFGALSVVIIVSVAADGAARWRRARRLKRLAGS